MLRLRNLRSYCNHKLDTMSPRVSAPPWNIDVTLFYPAPLHPKKNLNLSDPPPLPLWTTTLKNLLLSWNVPSPKKEKTRFSKKQMILFPTMKYEYIVTKSKNQKRNDFYFISAWWLVTDLMGIFNADSRKSVKNHYKWNLKQQRNKETSKL